MARPPSGTPAAKAYDRAVYLARRAKHQAARPGISAREALGHKPERTISTPRGPIVRAGGEAVIEGMVRSSARRGDGVAFTINRRREGTGGWRTRQIGASGRDAEAVGALLAAGGGPRRDMSGAEARRDFGALATRKGRARPKIDVGPGFLEPAELLELKRLYRSWWALLADLDDWIPYA